MFGVGRGSCRKRRRKNRWVKTDGRFGGVDSVWRDEGWWMDGGHAGRLAVGGRFGAGGRGRWNRVGFPLDCAVTLRHRACAGDDRGRV